MRFTLPENLTAPERPKAWQGDASGVKALLAYTLDQRDFVFARRVEQPAGFFALAGYEAARENLKRFQAANRRPVIFKPKL